VTSQRRRTWLVAILLGSYSSNGGAATWEIWPAVATWHGGGASQRSRQWRGCGRRGTWTAAVELAGDGRALGLGPDLGPLGLIWVGQTLLLLVSRASVEAHPLAMVWVGRRIGAGVPRSGSWWRPLLGSVGLTCGCFLLVVPHCLSSGLLTCSLPCSVGHVVVVFCCDVGVRSRTPRRRS
jgi:hypothetical protein